MAGKTTRKPERDPYDRFSSDDRATDARSMGLKNITPPKKPAAAKKPAAKRKK